MIASDSMALNQRDPGRNVRALCAGHAVNRPGSLHLRTAQMRTMIQVSTGDRYGRLTIVSENAPRRYPSGKKRVFTCRCDCGTLVLVLLSDLRSGHTTSCGCRQREVVAQLKLSHGKCSSREHTSWSGMIQRCHNPDNPSYDRYGARGIVVCDRWRNSFAEFLKDMGDCPSGHTIERVNNEGPYSPENCVWATPTTQNRNRRSSLRLTLNGVTRTASEWAVVLNIKPPTLYSRIARGWPPELALSKPARAYQCR